MWGDKIKAILIEAVSAVSWHERCVFYAQNTFPADVAPHVVLRTGSPPTYSDFLQYLKIFETRLKVASPQRATFIIDAVSARLSIKIYNVYADGLAILYNRFLVVSHEYESQRAIIRKIGIGLADRDRQFASVEASNLFGKCNTLLTSSNQRLVGLSSSSLPFEFYSCEWELLRNCATLFMDEISFLNQRIDEFRQIIDAFNASKDTTTSISIAKYSLIATAICGILALILGFYQWQYPISNENNETKADANNAIINAKIYNLVKKVSELENATKAQAAQIDNISTSTSEKLEKLKDQLSRIEGNLKDQAVSIAKESTANFQLEINYLRQQVMENQRSIDINTSQNPQEIQELQTKINVLTLSLGRLETAIAKKEFPQVNVIVSAQKPSKKAIGLINVDASSH